MKNYYKIIERNVDYAGQDVEEYLFSDRPMTKQEKKSFSEILKEVKYTCTEAQNTEDYVWAACVLFNKRFSNTLRPTSSPFEDVFEF